ncbi:hypothetical protein VHUM_02061 [Vanrija humicola]|uniref:Major facilitator superfamily (MFS) profile domain-containing protein n=1 Tax=Vanrija humicola TaxID=5417 RepID=A0A7D8YZD9_VANHU|nr:hypothetical protein VHUM_02061 [Vanrija humicola]
MAATHQPTLAEVNNELTLVRTLSPQLRRSGDDDLIDGLEAKKRELQEEAGVPATPPAAAPTTPAIDPPPDGGLTAWLVVAGGFLLMFSMFGFVTGQGQLQLYYLRNQLSHYPRSTVAWIASTQMALVFMTALLFGRYFDRHGARHLVIGGVSLMFGSLIALAFSKEFYQILLSHIAFGLGGGFIYSPSTGIAGHWFVKKRALAISIIVGGGGFGGIVYPIMIRELTNRFKFRDAILIVAGINFVLQAPAIFWMKTRLPPRTPPPLKLLLEPWKETRFFFMVVGASGFAINLFTPYFNAPVYAASHTKNHTINEYAVAFLQVGSCVGRMVGGPIAMKCGIWNTYGTFGFLTCATIVAMWTGAPVGSAGAVIGLFLYGFTSGATITLTSASMASISPIQQIGMRFAMLWTGVGLGVLIGPPVAGKLVTVANGDFKWAGVFCACTMFVFGWFNVTPGILNKLRARKERQADAERSSGTSVDTAVGVETK